MGGSSGAKDEIRTRDPDLGKVVLYQLSYFRLVYCITLRTCDTDPAVADRALPPDSYRDELLSQWAAKIQLKPV